MQYIFGSEIGDVSQLSAEEIYQRALIGSLQLQEKLTVLPVASTSHLVEDTLPIGTVANSSMDRYGTARPLISLLSHSHFINYGGKFTFGMMFNLIEINEIHIHGEWSLGGYYSYLLAKMYAAQIWYKVFADDPLNR